MDEALLNTLFSAFIGDGSVLLYSGAFHDSHTARLIVLAEESAEDKEHGKGLRTRAVFVLLEAYQNIIRHRAILPTEQAQGLGRSLLLLRASPGRYEVSTMNPVSNADALHVVQQLNGLEALDQDQLKERYLDTLKRATRTARGGAGLGLIEIARRSGHALQHQLSPIDTEHQLFALRIVLEGSENDADHLRELERLHPHIAAAELLLFCKGMTTPRALEALERIVELEVVNGTEGSVRAGRMVRILMELLLRAGADQRSFGLSLFRFGEGHRLVGCALLDTHAAQQLLHTGDKPISDHAEPGIRALVQELKALAQGEISWQQTPTGDGQLMIHVRALV